MIEEPHTIVIRLGQGIKPLQQITILVGFSLYSYRNSPP